MIRILIADDHPTFRAGLRTVLAAPDLRIVAETASGTEAIALAATLRPDVVVLDVELEDLDGLSATARISSPTLILTMHDRDDILRAALSSGARGYLLKGATGTEITAAVRTLATGAAYFGKDLAHRLASLSPAPRTPPALGPFAALTPRELETLTLLSRGHGTAEISRRLHLSPKTVRNHISNLLTKLGVPDRAAAVARARDTGL